MKFDEGERGQLLGGVKDNILPTTTIPILIQIYYGLYFAPTHPTLLVLIFHPLSLVSLKWGNGEILPPLSPSPSRLLFFICQVLSNAPGLQWTKDMSHCPTHPYV